MWNGLRRFQLHFGVKHGVNHQQNVKVFDLQSCDDFYDAINISKHIYTYHSILSYTLFLFFPPISPVSHFSLDYLYATNYKYAQISRGHIGCRYVSTLVFSHLSHPSIHPSTPRIQQQPPTHHPTHPYHTSSPCSICRSHVPPASYRSLFASGGDANCHARSSQSCMSPDVTQIETRRMGAGTRMVGAWCMVSATVPFSNLNVAHVTLST